MKETPTSGPVRTSITQKARDAVSSRHSLTASQASGPLGEGKEDLLQVRRPSGQRLQLLERALTAHAAAGEQDEAVAQARRLDDLVDGQEERPARGRVLAQQPPGRAGLRQVQPVERLVDQQQRL